MAGEEGLGARIRGRFCVHVAREAEDHDEQIDLGGKAADLMAPELAEVALGLLAGRRLEAHHRAAARHAIGPRVVFEDRDAAGIAHRGDLGVGVELLDA